MVQTFDDDETVGKSSVNDGQTVSDTSEEFPKQVVCSVLYGAKSSFFVAALALGKQLRTQSSRNRYLLHDASAMEDSERKSAAAQYWNLIEVQRISSKESCHFNARSLKDVFIKLRVLEVFPEGTEILFLDLDILVLENVDILFDVPAPAGKFHGRETDICRDVPRPLKHGTKLQTFHPYTCINAGVLRLRAGKEAFQAMMREIDRRRQTRDISQRSYLPEQYLLVYDNWFKAPWFLLDDKYNKEVDPRLQDVSRSDLDGAVIAHFSCNSLKPWNYFGPNRNRLSEGRELGDCDFHRWIYALFTQWQEIVEKVALELEHFHGLPEIIEELRQGSAW